MTPRTSKKLSRLKFLALVDAEARRRGWACESCGEEHQPGRFHWHHRNPDTMVFRISAGEHRSLDDLAIELAKCDLLCPECHRRKHRKRTPWKQQRASRRARSVWLDP